MESKTSDKNPALVDEQAAIVPDCSTNNAMELKEGQKGTINATPTQEIKDGQNEEATIPQAKEIQREEKTTTPEIEEVQKGETTIPPAKDDVSYESSDESENGESQKVDKPLNDTAQKLKGLVVEPDQPLENAPELLVSPGTKAVKNWREELAKAHDTYQSWDDIPLDFFVDEKVPEGKGSPTPDEDSKQESSTGNSGHIKVAKSKIACLIL